MEYIRLSKCRGFKYACNNHLYSQYCKKKGIVYLRCDSAGCKGTAKIDDDALFVMNDHDEHSTMETEISKLRVLDTMRKRAADDDSTSLRNIYLEEMRHSEASDSVGYATVESSLYKRRRIQQPTLPATLDDVPDAIQNSRYATVKDSNFYRGRINAGQCY